MLTDADRQKRYSALEAARQRRIDNLRLLQTRAGSWAELGRLTGQAPAFLIALAGHRPTRNVGEKLARSLEAALRLPTGWLDAQNR